MIGRLQLQAAENECYHQITSKNEQFNFYENFDIIPWIIFILQEIN